MQQTSQPAPHVAVHARKQGRLAVREVLFLQHLRRHIPSPLIVIWDGLSAHGSRLVRDYVAGPRGAIHLEFLPAYAPELNPVDYIWGYCKQHELPNFCPKNFAQLGWLAKAALRNAPPPDPGRVLLETGRIVMTLLSL